LPKEVDTGLASQEVPVSDDPSPKDPPPGGRSADYLPYGVDTIVIPFTWSDRQEVPVSGDPLSMDLPPEGRSADRLPYGVDTIVIPFTWSGPQRRRLPWRRFGGNKWVTGPGPYPPSYVGQSAAIAERNFARALRDAQQTSTELALSALQTLRGSSHSFHPHDAGTAAAADAGLSGSSGADGDRGSPGSDTEGFGATALDQASAMLASFQLSGASPPTDAGTAATADAGAAAGAAAAGVGKPTTRTHPCRFWTTRAIPS